MTAVPTSEELVVFLPPGCAQGADASCVLLAGDSEVARFILRRGAHMLEVAGHAIITGARSADRPVVVRVALRNGEPWCAIGLRPPIAIPALSAAFAFDTVEAPPGATAEIIAMIPATALPRGLAAGTGQAGAIDHVSSAGGISGWIADPTRAEPHRIELRCGLELIATALADRPRPAGAPMVHEAPLGRFSIPWFEVDRDALSRCPPNTAVVAFVPALDARLADAYRPLSARTALALMGPEPRLLPLSRLPDLKALPHSLGLTGRGRTTAIIPNYNYARYLPERIATLIAPGTELILLDDASTDDSLAAARRAAPGIRIVASDRNSGAILPQWRRAAMLAETEYLLIAEADDVADPELIPTLAAMLDADPAMAFAFADSARIDADGRITGDDHKAYYAALGDRALEREQILPADKFLLRFLLPRNLIVNVSAVLWRTAALRAAFDRMGEEIANLRATGDWRVYIETCRAGGIIGYTPRVLNHFRRHDDSVIARQTRATHFAEIEQIHALLLTLTGNDAVTAERLTHHRATLRRLWSMDGTAEAP